MIIDIIAVVIAVLCIANGIKKGFVRAFFGTLSFFLAFILTFMFSSAAVKYVKESPVGTYIYEKTAVQVIDVPEDNENSGFFDELIDKKGIIEKADKAQRSVSEEIGNTVITLLTCVVLFIAITLLLKLLAHILNFAAKLPLLKSFNKLGGLIAGVLNAYVVLTLFSCIAAFIGASNVLPILTEQLEQSRVVNWLYLNNPLM